MNCWIIHIFNLYNVMKLRRIFYSPVRILPVQALCGVAFCVLVGTLGIVPLAAQQSSQGSTPQATLQASAGSSVGSNTGSRNVRVFTLEECLQIAAASNLDVQDAVANATLSSADQKETWGAYLPTADVTLGYSRTLNTVTGFNLGGTITEVPVRTPDIFFSNARVGYTIFNGFIREGLNGQANANYEAAEKNATQTRRRILNTVRTQYFNVLRNKQIVATRREDFEVGKKQLERVKAQFEAGVTAIAAVYTQEADLSNRELAIVQAENDLELAKGQLLATLGMNPTLAADVTDVQMPQTLGEKELQDFRTSIATPDNAAAEAVSKRADHEAAKSSILAAEQNLRSSNGRWLPTVSAGFDYRWNGTDIASFGQYSQQNLSLIASYNVFDGFTRDAAIQRSQIRLEQAQIRKRQTEQRIASEVQNAYTQLNAAEKNLDITARALKSAEQNFQAAEERFKVGAANILDYTTANGQRVNARINRINAIYSYLAAQYQTRFALGLLEE
jgi:outer membrane protein